MKCSICGMSKDGNPAHARDYTGTGKHSPKFETKSIDLPEDAPISFGSELKSLGNGKYGAWALLFSDHESPDITSDYFDKDTDFFFEGEQKAIRPVLYDHGLDATLKSRKLGRGSLEIKDAGVWFETQLDIADEYDKKYLPYIETMAQAGRLGVSTGSAPHLIKREAVGKAMYIKSWPIVEVSLTPKPVEPRTKMPMALKSYAEVEREDLMAEFLDTDAGIEFKAQIDDLAATDSDPHEYVGDGNTCEQCGEPYDAGNHVSKKALEFLKGGPGSGPRPGQRNRAGTGHGRVLGRGMSDAALAADTEQSDREYILQNQQRSELHQALHNTIMQQVVGADREDNASSLRDAVTASYKAGLLTKTQHTALQATIEARIIHDKNTPGPRDRTIASGVVAGKNYLLHKSRNNKSLFDDKLAQHTQSIYELDRARDEVFRDIIAAEKVSGVTGTYIDKRAKVTETVTEYAARLVLLVLEQMEKYLDGEYDTNSNCSPVGNSMFYLRSFEDESPLQTFLSIKSLVGVRPNLSEHSSMAVSALEEFATETGSLIEGVKSLIERVEEKIQFRLASNDRSGQLISADTLGTLQEAKGLLDAAFESKTELVNQLNGLVDLATPKKPIDLTGYLTLALAEHENEMAQVPHN